MKVKEMIFPDWEKRTDKNLKVVRFLRIISNLPNKLSRKLFVYLQKYIDSPIVIDDCSSHDERREWLKTLKKEEPDIAYFVENNKLRVNNMSKVVYAIQILLPGEFEDVLELLVKEIKSFHEKTLDKKLEIVNQMTDIAIKAHNLIVEKYS